MLTPGKLYKTKCLLNNMSVGSIMLLLSYKSQMWGTQKIIVFEFLVGNKIETIALYEIYISPYLQQLK